MKNVKRVIKYALIFLLFIAPIIFIGNMFSKSKLYLEYANMKVMFGNYYEWGTGGRGASEARYSFRNNNKKTRGVTSHATFKESSPIVGKNYIVVYNGKNPRRSTMFLNLPVHDSMSHYFKRGSIDKIPIESYQRTIDSFYLINLTRGFNRFFPPYYKKEDFPELEYLWGEEE